MRIGQVAHAHIRADRHHRLAIFQPSVRAAHRQTNKVVIIAHAPAQRAHRSRRSGERQARSHWKRRAGDARLIGIAAERDAAAGHAQKTALLRRPPCFQIPAQPDVRRRHPARVIRGLGAAEAPVRALPEQRHRLVRQHRGELKRVVVPVPRPRGAQEHAVGCRAQTCAPHADTPACTSRPRSRVRSQSLAASPGTHRSDSLYRAISSAVIKAASSFRIKSPPSGVFSTLCAAAGELSDFY